MYGITLILNILYIYVSHNFNIKHIIKFYYYNNLQLYALVKLI